MEMTNKYHRITAVCAATFIWAATGCNLLETYPSDGIGSNEMWQTEEHVELGVTAAYSIMRQKGSYSRNVLTDAYTPYAFIMNTGFDDNGQRYFCYNTATTGFGVFSSKWENDYRGVQYANLAISKIPQVTMDEGKRNVYLGESHFLRALYYFDLLTFFSGHKNSDLGVPLYTEMPEYDKAFLPRATPADVREVMISDLKKAIELLPWRPEQKGRASRSAALMLLGKVYLYADLYTEAAETFSQLMKENEQSGEAYTLSSDYGKMFTLEGENNNEYMFVISCLDTYGNGSYTDLLYSTRSANCSGTNTSIPTIYLANAYLNKDGSNFTMPSGIDWNNETAVNAVFENRDPRLGATIIRPWAKFVGSGNVTFQYRSPYDTRTTPYPCLRTNNGLNDHYCWRKFCNTGNETTIRRHSPTDIPIMRWADALLLYAEALNEAYGPDTEVWNAIDEVRTRAGMPKVKHGGQSETREIIRSERIYELAGEGQLWFDWQRWYAHDPSYDYESLLNHQILGYKGAPIGAQAGTRAFTSRNWCYAVPKSETDQNPAIKQAPGWNN